MALNLKASIFIVLAIISTILYYNAYIANQPCRHKLASLKESDKIQLQKAMIDRLMSSLAIKTISNFNSQNKTNFIQYIEFIRKEFSAIEKYTYVKFNLINEYSILYKIEGKDSTLKPYLLAAHFDTVPVNQEEWKYYPFGELIDGYIYARGTLDDKASMIAQLEAVDVYLKKFGQPKRTIYLAYGHDEELSGEYGAKMIAKHLENVSLEYVLDEGTMIIEDVFPELEKPIALVSIADKGYLTLKFSVNTTSGHSSMPDHKNSAIFILAEAVTKLNHGKFPSLLGKGPELITLKHLAVYFGVVRRILLSNIWLFKPLIDFIFSQAPSTDSLLRTTTSVNIFSSGQKDNVMPSYAEFYVNHRIHSFQSCQEVIDHDLKAINDKRINYEVISCIEPSPISPSDSLGFTLIDHSTREIHNDVLVIPGVMVGLTDSRYYTNLTKNVYKYNPTKVSNEDIKGFHGADERISLESYKNMINFYFQLVKNTDESHLKVESIPKEDL